MPTAVVTRRYVDGGIRLTAVHPENCKIKATTFLPLPVTDYVLARAYDWLAAEIDDLTGQPFGAWTQTQQRRYVHDRGAHCPHCGFSDVHRGDTHLVTLGRVELAAECMNCARHWLESYKLSDVHPMAEEEK